jgi:hypothetical protein
MNPPRSREGLPLSNVIYYPHSISQFSHGSTLLGHGVAINFGKMGPSRSSLGKGPFPGCIRAIKSAIQSNHSRRSRYEFSFVKAASANVSCRRVVPCHLFLSQKTRIRVPELPVKFELSLRSTYFALHGFSSSHFISVLFL